MRTTPYLNIDVTCGIVAWGSELFQRRIYCIPRRRRHPIKLEWRV